MRRSDREITDKAVIEEFLLREQIMRVAFYDAGDIYIVPVNYGCLCGEDGYTFYFHGARAGRKFELAKAQPTVGFEIDGGYKLLESDIACNFSAKFQSVIGTGILSTVEDKQEMRRGLDALMRQTTQKGGWEYNDKMLDAVAVYRIHVDKLSCKAK